MTQNAVVFIDYENVRHYARWPQGAMDEGLNPWSLGRAICALHNRRAQDVPLECGEVRVYLGVSNESVEETAQRHYKGLRTTWEKNRSVKVHSPRRRAKDGVVKEFYTQMSVDLLNWALDVSRGCREPEVAVLFSVDRDCAPALRSADDLLRSHPTARIDVVCWHEYDQWQRDQMRGWAANIVPNSDLERHLLTWDDYREALA